MAAGVGDGSGIWVGVGVIWGSTVASATGVCVGVGKVTTTFPGVALAVRVTDPDFTSPVDKPVEVTVADDTSVELEGVAVEVAAIVNGPEGSPEATSSV